MSNNRDDFSEETKRKLGERVNLLCSNPDCRAPTKGPHTDDGKAANVGVAAHIRGASPNGPRYDATQTPDQRRSIENGIWLCRICDKKVDGDEARYPPDLLRAWKVMAEHAADQQLGKPALPVQVQPVPSPTHDVGRLRLLILEVEHVRDRAKEDAGFLSRGPLSLPARYDYQPIKDALSFVPVVLTDASLRGFIKSLRESIEDLERGPHTGLSLQQLIKNVCIYSDHVFSGLNTLLNRLEAPADALAPARHNVEIGMTYKITKMIPTTQPHTHECELHLNFKNAGKSRIDDWSYEIEFPTPMLNPGVVLLGRVEGRSNKERTLVRVSNAEPLHAGDTKEVALSYRVTDDLTHPLNLQPHGATRI